MQSAPACYRNEMAERIILLHEERDRTLAVPPTLDAPTGLLSDALARPLHDLRISITDRCNFRCVYCMPKEVFDKDYAYLPHRDLLTFELRPAARIRAIPHFRLGNHECDDGLRRSQRFAVVEQFGYRGMLAAESALGIPLHFDFPELRFAGVEIEQAIG